MHTCCGPCSVYPLEKLSEEGHEVFGLFFNPNIHPYTEFKNRLDSAKIFYDLRGKKLIVIDEYPWKSFYETVLLEKMQGVFIVIL